MPRSLEQRQEEGPQKLVQTPIDNQTGVPHAIAPVEWELDVNDGSQAQKHHSEHPSDNPTLVLTPGGRGIRYGRIQFVAPEQHNIGSNRYHRFWGGPEIPRKEPTQFGLLVMLRSGVITDKVLDISKGMPIARPIKEWERERLRTPYDFTQPSDNHILKYTRKRPHLTLEEGRRELIAIGERNGVHNYQYIRSGYNDDEDFMAHFVTKQPVSEENFALAEEFLTLGTEATDTGLELLSSMVSSIMSRTVYRGQILGDMYHELWQADKLAPGLPEDSAEFVINKLGPEHKRAKLLPALYDNLLASANDDAESLVAAVA